MNAPSPAEISEPSVEQLEQELSELLQSVMATPLKPFEEQLRVVQSMLAAHQDLLKNLEGMGVDLIDGAELADKRLRHQDQATKSLIRAACTSFEERHERAYTAIQELLNGQLEARAAADQQIMRTRRSVKWLYVTVCGSTALTAALLVLLLARA